MKNNNTHTNGVMFQEYYWCYVWSYW